MSTTATICLAAACLILIVQVTNAWEAKPCDGFKGKLIALDVHNCPDKSAEYCEIKISDPISWDVWYTAGVSYEKAITGYNVPDSFKREYTEHAKKGFCPGKEGEAGGYHFQMSRNRTDSPGTVYKKFQLFTAADADADVVRKLFQKNALSLSPSERDFLAAHQLSWKLNENFVVCAEFPVKFVE